MLSWIGLTGFDGLWYGWRERSQMEVGSCSVRPKGLKVGGRGLELG